MMIVLCYATYNNMNYHIHMCMCAYRIYCDTGMLPSPRTNQQTAMALYFVKPSLTAFRIAVLSAQIVNPYEAFSTLQPDMNE